MRKVENIKPFGQSRTSKNKNKKPHFAKFPRLGESDPYADKRIVKCTSRPERLVILPKKLTRSHKNHAYNQLPVLLIGTKRKLQKAEVKCMYYITANMMLSQKKTWLDQDQTWFG